MEQISEGGRNIHEIEKQRKRLESVQDLNFRLGIKVSLLGVDSLWGDCTFIPADWGS